MGPGATSGGTVGLSAYLLDTTVLIAHIRGEGVVTDALLRLVQEGHTLSTSCVNVAELERGTLPGNEGPFGG